MITTRSVRLKVLLAQKLTGRVSNEVKEEGEKKFGSAKLIQTNLCQVIRDQLYLHSGEDLLEDRMPPAQGSQTF